MTSLIMCAVQHVSQIKISTVCRSYFTHTSTVRFCPSEGVDLTEVLCTRKFFTNSPLIFVTPPLIELITFQIPPKAQYVENISNISKFNNKFAFNMQW